MDKQKVIDHALDFAKKWMMENGSLVPQFHAWDGDERSILIAAPWDSEESKAQILVAVRALFAAERVKCYMLVSEVWMRSVSGRDKYEEHRRSGKMVEEYADKEEAVSLIYVSYEEKIMCNYGIRRGADGKVTGFTDTPIYEGGSVSGRMVELLPVPTKVVSMEERRLAKRIREVLDLENFKA